MGHRLQLLAIRSAADVPLARDRVKVAAHGLGLTTDDVTRIATASSELARCISERGAVGEMTLEAEELPHERLALVVTLASTLRFDCNPELSWDPVRAARSLVDRWDECAQHGRFEVQLTKIASGTVLAPGMLAERARAASLALESADAAGGPMQLHSQNRELARLLGELRRRGDELARVNEDLERANNDATAAMLRLCDVARQKDELSAAIAHDLRSPLSAVKGALELLNNGSTGTLSAEQQKVVALAQRSMRNVLELVNDLMETSLLDAGLARLDPSLFELSQVVEDISATATILARDKNIELDVHIDEDLPPLYADRHKLGQVIANLLSNAVKFTEPGGRIELFARAIAGGRIVLRISDTGVGMPPDRVDSLFDKYKRKHSRGTRGERGTGLGLYICKQLVELLGGQIGVASAVGRGTTFEILLPCAVVAQVEQAEGAEA